MAEHSKRSPSSAHRWMNCPGSPRMVADVVRKPNEYAKVGTCAHALIDYCLKKRIESVPRERIDEPFTFEFNDLPASHVVTAEIALHCDLFIRNIYWQARSFPKPPKLYQEYRVDLSHVGGAGMMGTADTVLSGERLLIVSDFKYGFLPVYMGTFPKLNEQLLLYASGICNEHLWLHDEVTLEIVQPRSISVPDIQRATVKADWLYQWTDEVAKPAAEAADKPDAPLKAGDWCRFCPAAFKCPELARQAQEVARTEFLSFAPVVALPPLTKEQMLRVLEWTPVIDHWLREVNAHAFDQMCSGENFPGFKLVRGRGSRHFPPEAEDVLRLRGLTDADIYEPRKMRSPAQLEKLSPNAKEIVESLVIKKPGGLTLAIDADKRSTVVSANEFADYVDIGL